MSDAQFKDSLLLCLKDIFRFGGILDFSTVLCPHIADAVIFLDVVRLKKDAASEADIEFCLGECPEIVIGFRFRIGWRSRSLHVHADLVRGAARIRFDRNSDIYAMRNIIGIAKYRFCGNDFIVDGPGICGAGDIFIRRRYGERLSRHNRIYCRRIVKTDLRRHQLGVVDDLVPVAGYCKQEHQSHYDRIGPSHIRNSVQR